MNAREHLPGNKGGYEILSLLPPLSFISFNFSHSPSYHSSPFFSFLARKYTMPCGKQRTMEKITFCRSVRHRLHILSFTETYYESFLDFENISLYTLQDTCGGPDTELKLDIMKLTCYIIQRTVFSKHRNISYEIFQISKKIKNILNCQLLLFLHFDNAR